MINESLLKRNKRKEIIWFFKHFDVTLHPKQDNSHEKLLFLLLVAIIYTFSSCSEKKTEEKKTVIDTIPMMVMQIQNATDFTRQKYMSIK